MTDKILEELYTQSLKLKEKLFHMHYFVHELNLIVKDELEMIGHAIEKVHDSVFYWTDTPKRWETFERMQEM